MTESAAPMIPAPPADRGLPRRAGADAENTLKTLAKTLARDATAEIHDRHLRARIRTRCYNQALCVLRDLEGRHAAQRQRDRRALAVLGSFAMLALAAFAVTLAV